MPNFANLPRLSVFRSNKHITVQLIDDSKKTTLASSSDNKKRDKKNKMDIAHEVGLEIAKKASDLKMKKVIFDRGSYKYHGRVKSLAEGARKGGLVF